MTSWPEAAERLTARIAGEFASLAAELAVANATLGCGSLSVIVKVWTVLAPSVALLGADSVTWMVSFGSLRPSLMIAIGIVFEVCPGENVKVPLASV